MAPRIPSRPVLEVRLLGALSVRFAGAEEIRLPSRRAGWLLGALALREGKPIERQRLAGQIWADSPDDASLHNLRQTLSQLRKRLDGIDLVIPSPPRSIALR